MITTWYAWSCWTWRTRRCVCGFQSARSGRWKILAVLECRQIEWLNDNVLNTGRCYHLLQHSRNISNTFLPRRRGCVLKLSRPLQHSDDSKYAVGSSDTNRVPLIRRIPPSGGLQAGPEIGKRAEECRWNVGQLVELTSTSDPPAPFAWALGSAEAATLEDIG